MYTILYVPGIIVAPGVLRGTKAIG